eukprot:2836901-Rhodomonas_salina.1
MVVMFSGSADETPSGSAPETPGHQHSALTALFTYNVSLHQYPCSHPWLANTQWLAGTSHRSAWQGSPACFLATSR